MTTRLVREAPTERATGRGERTIAAVELAAISAFVLLDLFIPTLLILCLAAISLAARRQGLASLGLRRPSHTASMLRSVTIVVLAWTVAQISVIMPLLNRLTGQTQDLSQFEGLQGNLALLLGFLALTWTLAAVGEEISYRGLALTRAATAMGSQTLGLVVAAVLFGFAHTEQGVVGIVVTTLDGLLFGWLRLHHGTLWAAVFAHGLSNTIGLVAFFVVGPIHGLW